MRNKIRASSRRVLIGFRKNLDIRTSQGLDKKYMKIRERRANATPVIIIWVYAQFSITLHCRNRRR